MASSSGVSNVPPGVTAQSELQQSPPTRQDAAAELPEQQLPPYEEPAVIAAQPVPTLPTQQSSAAPIEIPDDSNYRMQDYNPQMMCSLCMLVTCLICCNFFSLIFTVPAVLFSWRAVQAAQGSNYRDADQRKSAAYTCVLLAMFQFIIMIILLAIAAAVFTLVQTDVINISLSE